MTAINGGSFEESMQNGWNNAKVGLATGGVSGVVSGLQRAKAENVNWLTGKTKIGVTADDLGVSLTMDRIMEGESYPHRNDGSTFHNDLKILPIHEDGYYKEYVHPTPGLNHPGLQRIITGNGGEYYYTPNHYKTFIRFKYTIYNR
jgi:guanyl-specific ribonuclease Sa